MRGFMGDGTKRTATDELNPGSDAPIPCHTPAWAETPPELANGASFAWVAAVRHECLREEFSLEQRYLGREHCRCACAPSSTAPTTPTIVGHIHACIAVFVWSRPCYHLWCHCRNTVIMSDQARKASFGSSAGMAQLLMGNKARASSDTSASTGEPVPPPRSSAQTSATAPQSASSRSEASGMPPAAPSRRMSASQMRTLADDEFERIFQMKKKDFDGLPEWRQIEVRKEKGVY